MGLEAAIVTVTVGLMALAIYCLARAIAKDNADE